MGRVTIGIEPRGLTHTTQLCNPRFTVSEYKLFDPREECLTAALPDSVNHGLRNERQARELAKVEPEPRSPQARALGLRVGECDVVGDEMLDFRPCAPRE